MVNDINSVPFKKNFFSLLEDLFVGEELEGKSGFVNLLSLKHKYFKDIKKLIEDKVNQATQEYKDKFIELNDAELSDKDIQKEIFEKLYTFFELYLDDTGTILFNKTPMYKNLYEKVYDETEDVGLFWKTQDMYFIKSESHYKSLNTTIDGITFKFDASELEHESNNEKNNIVFVLTKIEGSTINLKVKKNKDDNLKGIKNYLGIKKNIRLHLIENRKELIESNDSKLKITLNDIKLEDSNLTQSLQKKMVSIKQDDDLFDTINIEFGVQEIENIIEYLDRLSYGVDPKTIRKACGIYKKQNEIDYFIHKNAGRFLKEQFKKYMFNYIYDNDAKMSSLRIAYLEQIKRLGYEVIDYIAKFEDELKNIWEKPKFVRKSNYVLALSTLKQLLDDEEYQEIKTKTVAKILDNKDYYEDIEFTFKQVYKYPLEKVYVDEIEISEDKITANYVKVYDSSKKKIEELKSQGKSVVEKTIFDKNEEVQGVAFRYSADKLPEEIDIDNVYIDTQYFEKEFVNDLLEKISQKHKLNELLDGHLIKSDNYQALNNIKKLFANDISLIYVDPPFNTDNEGFIYKDKFKDSTWLTMLDNRLEFNEVLLKNDASFYMHLDHNGNYLGRFLINRHFSKDMRREIVWNTSPSPSGYKSRAQNWIRQHDTIFYYSEKEKPVFNKMFAPQEKHDKVGWLDVFKDDNKDLYVKRYLDNKNELEKDYIDDDIKTLAIGDVWNDVYSMMFSQNMTRENWGEDNTQKPENLLRRIVQGSSNQNDWVMDYYVGSGTTISAAHKLNRRWIGVEMGSHFYDVILPRMKTVVFGDQRAMLTRDLNWKGGGFFKYYELEDYEDVLFRASYNDLENQSLLSYSFDEGDKLLSSLDIDYENEEIEIDFTQLYGDIDIAETISHLIGQHIIKYENGKVKFDNDTVVDLNNLDYKEYSFLKPLLWWGSLDE